jgi:hypothetical protein
MRIIQEVFVISVAPFSVLHSNLAATTTLHLVVSAGQCRRGNESAPVVQALRLFSPSLNVPPPLSCYYCHRCHYRLTQMRFLPK